MAVSGAALAAKAAAALLTDKRTWRVIAVLIAAILTPVILVIACILNLASAAAHHNNAALNLTFNGGNITASIPAEFHGYITEMQSCFDALDAAVEEIGEACEWEDGELDMVRVKAVFYALFFGSEELSLRRSAARSFTDCFLEYEDRTRPCGDDDCDDEDCEEYTVAIPIVDLPTAYANVGDHIGRPLTPEDMANISEIYLRVTRGDFSVGTAMPLDGGSNGTHDLIAELTAGDQRPAPTDGYASPVAGDWRSLISCEYGTGYAGHTGMDLAIPMNTPIYAVADGTVLFTRASSSGYGVHVAVNHGGGVVTLYAHCSRLLVGEGQQVSQGEMIALSGSTGNSTGPHLHLEFIIDGQHQNPRGYLS